MDMIEIARANVRNMVAECRQPANNVSLLSGLDPREVAACKIKQLDAGYKGRAPSARQRAEIAALREYLGA
jgi:hypothetical protein